MTNEKQADHSKGNYCSGGLLIGRRVNKKSLKAGNISHGADFM